MLDDSHIMRALDAVVGMFDPEAEAAVVLPQLSACDILLLIAMCKLERARELPSFSFDMVHFEYAKHVKSGNLSGKQVLNSAFSL